MRIDSPLLAVLALAAMVLAGWAVLTTAKRVLGGRVVRAATRTRTPVDDLVVHLIDRTGLPAIAFLVLWAAPPALPIPVSWHGPLRTAAMLALTVQLAILVNATIRFVTDRIAERAEVRAS